MISIYKERATQFFKKESQLKQKLGWLSLIRLLSFLTVVLLVYAFAQTGSVWVIIAAITLFGVFLYLVRWYGKLQQQRQYFTALASYNEKEAHFLKTNIFVYDAGKEYEDPHHPYSYDLDFFSEGGVFSYLNRCSTSFGKEQLAQDLLHPDISIITQRQEAVKELAPEIDFRQQLYAHGSLYQSKKKDLERLMQWIDGDVKLIGNKGV
ncbi:MAG: hypothetical protein QM640_01240 [Niabella sp.]